MTNTSKFGRVAGIVGASATTYAKGPAAVGFALTQRGYRLARQEIARRQAVAASRPAAPARPKVLVRPKASARPKVSVRTKRFVIFGGLAAVVAGIAVVATRRRHEIAPPADAPPSLADYTDSRDKSGERVNGSAPAHKS